MSERPKYQIKIDERIMAYPFGTAFSTSDFQIDFQVPNFKSIASSDFETDCKFPFSNGFLLLIFKPIS